MIWTQIIYFVVTLILSIALSPKPQKPRAAALDDFELPTAEEGRPIPVVFGEVDISGANVLWYGDLQVKPIKKRSGFSKATVGYKYYLGFHLGLCHGEIDAVTRVAWDDKEAWTGNITANGSGTINQPNLFGGNNRGGGVQGDFDVAFGGTAQTANAYLQSKVGETPPAFRGIVSLYWKGGYVGNSEFVKGVTVRCKRLLKGWEGTVWYSSKLVVDGGFNPIHAVYQCLTDTRWGMGVPATRIDEANFQEMADVLFDEGFGMHMIWNQSATIEQFIQIIMDHVGGGLAFNLATGKYQITLFRGNYDPDDLNEYGQDEILVMNKYEARGFGENVNEVTLSYTDPDTLKMTSISTQELASVDSQNARIPAIIELKGIRDHAVAREVLGRELAQRTMPLTKVNFEINRAAWHVAFGDVFKLTWPPRKCFGKVFRVLKISKGTLQSNSISIEALEDIFQYSVGTGLAHQDNELPFVPPSTPPDDDDNSTNVISTTVTDPPSASAGDRYIVPPGATGAWAGHEGDLAEWDDEDGWVFTELADNTFFFDEETNQWYSMVGGVKTSPPWTPGIPPLPDVADDSPQTDVALLDFVVYDNSTSSYKKISGDQLGVGGGGGQVAGTIILAEVHDDLEEFIGLTTMTVVGDGAVDPTDPIIGDNSWDNNGTNSQSTDYVRFEGDSTLLIFDGDFVWDGWFKPGASDGEYMMLIGTDTAAVAGMWQLHRNPGSNVLQLTRHNGSGYVAILVSSAVFTPNVWHYVRVVRSGSTMELSIDGHVEDTDTNADTFGIAISSATAFNVGRGLNSDNSDFNGSWQMVRVIKGNATELGDFDPPTSFLSSQFLTVEEADARYSREIPGRTEETAPDPATNYVLLYDTVAGAYRKVLLENLPFSGGGGGTTVVTGAGTVLYSQSEVLSGDEVTATSETAFASTLTAFDPSSLEPGDVIRVRWALVYTTSGTPSFRFRLKFDATTLLDSGAINLPTATDEQMIVTADLVVTGDSPRQLECQGVLYGKYAGDAFFVALKNSAPVAVDLTAAADFETTILWGASSNSVELRQHTIELLSKTSSGGGGGGGYPWEDPPASPDAMDDEFDDASFDTTKWTWLNQGTATLSEADDVLELKGVATSGDNVRAIIQPVPGSTWRFRTKCFGHVTPVTGHGANYMGYGLLAYNSGNGRCIPFGPLFVNSWTLYSDRRTVSAFAGNVSSATINASGFPELDVTDWAQLEMECDGTNLLLRSSKNGKYFRQLVSEALATYIGTPTHVGLFAFINNGSVDMTGVFDYFRRMA